MADADKKKDDDDEEEGEGEEKSVEEEKEESEEASKYVTFWKSFGKYIKMGLIEDAANRTRLAKLLRYSTSKSGDKEISLEEYVANMKEDQKNIYYISGEDKESLLKSPSVRRVPSSCHLSPYSSPSLAQISVSLTVTWSLPNLTLFLLSLASLPPGLTQPYPRSFCVLLGGEVARQGHRDHLHDRLCRRVHCAALDGVRGQATDQRFSRGSQA